MSAQQLNVRGFVDAGVVFYPQRTPHDDVRVVADAIARVEPSIQMWRGLSIAGSVEARTDTYQQGGAGVRYWDRTLRRPALAVRALAATYVKGPLSLEVGKQFVRWGQSDIISPTDYFTARDYLLTAESEALAITAMRVTIGGANDSIEMVYAPRMTPSRTPLIDQRWIGNQAPTGLALENGETRYAGAPLIGLRYRRTGRIEYSLSVYRGPHHLPRLHPQFKPTEAAVSVGRTYPHVRGFGGDLVMTLPGVTLKAESAWLQARTHDADDYGLWVVQGERQQREWLLLAGYVGEWVSERRGLLRFAADRGLARAVIGRISREFDDRRSLVLEGVLRQNADGVYVKSEYSQPLNDHWRITLRVLVLGGEDADFLGQYRRNSLAGARARYSF